MRIYPSVDIYNGKCVKGVHNSASFEDYGDPIEWALKWQSMGAECLHLVDVNAAMGETPNYQLVEQIVRNLKIPVQFGGGIASWDGVKRCLEEIGISRIVTGTLAYKEMDKLSWARGRFGDRLIVSIDAIDGKVATHGREDLSDMDAIEFALRVKEAGIDTILYTDVTRDGTFKGPNLMRTEAMIKKTWMNIMVSGGIRSIEDIHAIRGTGACGAVIGRALYEGNIDFKQALELK